ncbi:uncharacterized protein LOC142976939 isoform X2 [Anticarsia gemmatalis]|uniref:uncharacterized protein LOC142976939 isoform X2 n=1 Tax=Anticarsia gemmatalis TaxID=129554 RepID=UPI003F773721
MTTVEFTVNGTKCTADDSLPRDTSLNAYLRYTLGLTGTKAMCHEGGCGSCIVMVRAKRCTSGQVEVFSVNSCLVLVFSCHGWEITTVEGVGNRKDGYSEVQKRLVAFNGTQCGYCTPGWVMHLSSLRDKNLTMEELEKSFACNTCRCTGFRPIMETIHSFATDATPELCQKVRDIEELSLCAKNPGKICDRKCSIKSEGSDWSVIEEARAEKSIALDFGKYKFFKVFDQPEIFDILNKHGVDSYMFVDGNTGKGIVENFEYPRILIDISEVKSLKTVEFDQNMVLGANVSLEDAMKIFKETAKTKSEFAYLAEFVKHIEVVANMPVRKIGSIAGNLMYKRAVPTYHSDLFLILECVGAVVTVRNSQGQMTTLKLTEFLNYDMMGSLMVNIEIPPLSSSHYYRSYKIMPRNQNALAVVNAAFLVELNANNEIVSARIVYGNIDPKFIHATNLENFLIGKNVFNDDVLQQAIKVLDDELIAIEIAGEQSPAARKKLGLGLFYKFILNICPTGIALSKYTSGGELVNRTVSKGTPDFQSDPSLYPLNQPISKLEAEIQAAGEARFVNDLPAHPGQVFGAFVLSTVHGGEVDTIDVDDIMSIEGVLAIFTAKDIPGVNSFAFPGIQLQTAEEEILATKIRFYGQPIAILVATSERLAANCAKKVKVTYKNVSTVAPVLTIDAAKKDSSRYIPGDAKIEPKTRGTDVKKVIKGVFEMGAQYHYYLEPMSCVVVPVDNTLEVYDSTQWMDLVQIAVARSLAIHESEVVVKVRRIGGGFGGKISRNAQCATACALVAKKMDRPCRMILPLQTNLTMAGRRYPAQCEYEVGVDDNGKIQYLDAMMVEDSGCTSNESILDFTAGGFANCYNTETWSLKTANVITDLPSNTFARAPGTCEGITSIEHIMAHIAHDLGKDPGDVRAQNMRTEDNDLPELIEVLKKDCNHAARVKEVENFNKSNRWMKKAISVNVMCFPVVFYGNYSALVSVYRGDGTVTVSTGGIEMGQGINTKAAQVCAYELGIPLESVKVVPHYSFVSANNVFSGSSITTESVCYSIIKACETLKSRLAPVRRDMPTATWKEIIKKAGDDEIDLCALYMMADTDPALKGYSAFAVSIVEVQMDILTGRFQILKANILEDVGVSANPKLDVGQVEGAYIQGVGYFTCEALHYDKQTGKLLSNRSLNYHVPLCLDIPIDFTVKLRYNHKNENGVLGSKTCGEMGICSSHGVLHALRSCIMESRKDSGYDDEWLYMEVPFETEVILKALNVKLEEFVLTK